eukprot:2765931-Alexandrium_andersonii.AAC.1
MSASLVGSEMCIRDSQRYHAGSLVGSGLLSAPHGRGSGRSGERPAPVSYTHLTLPTICSV